MEQEASGKNVYGWGEVKLAKFRCKKDHHGFRRIFFKIRRMKIEGNHIRIGIFILDGNQGKKNDPRRNYDRNNADKTIASNDFKAIKPWKNTKLFYLFRHEPVEQKVFRFEVSVDDG